MLFNFFQNKGVAGETCSPAFREEKSKGRGKMQTRFREHIYYTGQYAEVEVFPVFPKTRARKHKFQPSSELQELINQNTAERKCMRLIHANFTGDDYCIGLSYSALFEPFHIGQVKKDIKNFLRRLKRRYFKLGVELKYIYSIEQASRFHIHLICNNGMTRDEIEKCWGMGYANADRLQFSEFGVMDLSNYVQKQRLTYRRWVSSRNLIQPVEREHYISAKTAREYAESWNVQSFIERNFPDYWLVLDDSECILNTTNGFDYVRLFLCRKDAQLSFYSTSFAEFDDRVRRKIDSRDLRLPPDEEIWVQNSLFRQ